jgi:flavin reductase (DIM6/NTAB) family NADH-FMN oxidoreductase RutF
LEKEKAKAPLKGIDAVQFRKVMGQFATGVTVVTTARDGETRGMTANAFMAGSLDPPFCLVSVAKRANMHGHLTAAARFAVNVLAHDQSELALHFAGNPNPRAMIEMDWVNGLPVLRGACAHMAANVVATHDCGDHTLFVGHLFHMDTSNARAPLLYHESRFGSLVHRKEDQFFSGPEFW